MEERNKRKCSRETKETGLRVIGVAKDGGESRFSNSGRESAGGEERRREKGGRNGQKRKNQLLSPHVCFLRWRVLESWVLCCVVFRCGNRLPFAKRFRVPSDSKIFRSL
ncbi:hypothetical protein TNCV_1967531 [Trichonephila clavipes]|nr:hypothetical protein TNCV_1967531 [Trichonephila clavipes]